MFDCVCTHKFFELHKSRCSANIKIFDNMDEVLDFHGLCCCNVSNDYAVQILLGWAGSASD